MNRHAILKSALILCAAILIAGVVLGIKTTFGFVGYSYANAGKYSSGDAKVTKPVSNLQMHAFMASISEKDPDAFMAGIR